MGDVLEFPFLRGVRHGFSSIECQFQLGGGVAGGAPTGKKIRMFIKSANYDRTRSRGLVRGNHPDPVAKTRGENDYSCEVEIYLAELNQLLAEMGPGYGDKLFAIFFTYGENGFDTVTDEVLGCSIDATDCSNSQGPDPLLRKLDLKPLKVKLAGLDDLETPLVAPNQ